MLRTVVILAVLFELLVYCQSTRLIPVYDIRTEERFVFPEDFIKLVLEYQIADDKGGSQLYIPDQLDEEGYIINENGQLVPFKLYKKGNHGSRVMCFLHPRNCRGGFHKRLTDEAAPDGLSRDLYELKVYKRKHQMAENNGNFKTSYRIDDNVMFVPGYEEKSMEVLGRPSENNEHTGFERPELQNNMYGIFPSLKSEYYKNGINEIGISETDLETLKDMKEANLLLDDLSRGLEQVAEPPPLETGPRMKAEVEEYPAYELLNDYESRYRDNVDRHSEDVSVFSPADTVDLYEFRRRM